MINDKNLIKIIYPLTGLFIFILGAGLLTTVLQLHLKNQGFGVTVIALVTTGHYLGMILGAFKSEWFISKVGHIRAYATFAALLSTVSVLPGIFNSSLGIILLRFIGGVCVAGLYIVVESWILSGSSKKNRGQILSLYMISLYVAQSSSQMFLEFFSPDDLVAYITISTLTCLSILPVVLVPGTGPKLEKASALNIFTLYKISPSGVIGCFIAGLMQGAIYGLLPVFFAEVKYHVSNAMSLTLLGAALLQFPLGKLSDIIERRIALILVAALTLLSCFGIIYYSYFNNPIFYAMTFLFGGCAFSLYPISISHACDYVDPEDIVAAAQGLLFSYGIGACLGPWISSYFMLEPQGLFVFFSLSAGFLFIFFFWRTRQRTPLPRSEQQDFVTTTTTSPIVTEFNPYAKTDKKSD